MGPPLKLGIDLSGGVILVYEVDQTKKKPGEVVDMDKLVAAVGRRVNPGGQKEVTIRKYGVEQIEIIVPEVEEAEVQRIERIISTHRQSRVPHPGQQAQRQGADRAGAGRAHRRCRFSIPPATCWPGGCR